MKVIHAGFSKCGTKTMQAAFRELGLNNYDFPENYFLLNKEWMKIFEGEADINLFYQMFKNVDSVTDMPSFYFWEEILKAFPHTKIIVTTRSSEDDWWKSMKKQLDSRQTFYHRLISFLSPTARNMFAFAKKCHISIFGHYPKEPWFGPAKFNELYLRKAYRMHTEYVLRTAPKDQLLQFDLNDGWEPLCEFLDLPIPDVPFPHKNKNATMVSGFLKENQIGVRIMREAKLSASLIFLLLVFSLYKIISFLIRYGQSKLVIKIISNPLKFLLSI